MNEEITDNTDKYQDKKEEGEQERALGRVVTFCTSLTLPFANELGVSEVISRLCLTKSSAAVTNPVTELHVAPKGVGWGGFIPKCLHLCKKQRPGELICMQGFLRCLCGLNFKRENNWNF